MTKIENSTPICGAIRYLPDRLAECLCRFYTEMPERAEGVSEIRLRANGAFSLSIGDENIFPEYGGGKIICTAEEVERCVVLLCRNSYQSHECEIERGYISVSGGMRAGVAFSISPGGGVHTVNSVCIRIPKDVRCDVSPLFTHGIESMLIYSPPGVGKTTVLRLCIAYLCEMGLRCAVVDSRYELSVMPTPPLADYICGCERGYGIECALETLSPQVFICDELGEGREAETAMQTVNTGVPFIATAHADSLQGLLSRPGIAMLHGKNVFSKYVHLGRDGTQFTYGIDICG